MIDQGHTARHNLDAMHARSSRLLDASVGGEWIQAEVHVKSGCALRCTFGPLGIRSIETREETGVALRVWTKEGREGHVHADAAHSRIAEELVWRAREVAHRSAPGPLPRLPRGSDALSTSSPRGARTPEGGEHSRDVIRKSPAGQITGTSQQTPSADPRPAQWADPGLASAGADDGSTEEIVRDLAHRLIGEFSAAGRAGASLRQGWVETGATSVRIVNSLGREIETRRRIAAVGFLVGPSALAGKGSDSPPAVRYSVLVEDLSSVDPSRVVEEASWRAIASTGGRSISGRSITVAFEPRSASSWIRALLPRFVRGPLAAASPGVLRPAKGIDLIDDPARVTGGHGQAFDGEGRVLARREILRGGEQTGAFVDSRNQETPEDLLGPMRRDSFRDVPAPGPAALYLAPGERTRQDLLSGLGKGLFVTSLVPHSAAGAEPFAAWVRGVWVEGGTTRHPVSRTLLVMPCLGSLARVGERGSDLEFDASSPEVGAPTVIIEGVDLVQV